MAVFPPSVERWRSLVSKYFPPNEVDRALWVIQHESGGDPGIASRFNAGGGENSHGLWQINLNAHPGMQGKTNDPEAATAYAAQLFKTSGWQPWSVTHKGFPADLGSSAAALQSGSGTLEGGAVGGVVGGGRFGPRFENPQDPDFINGLPFTPADFMVEDLNGNLVTDWGAYMDAAIKYGQVSGMLGGDTADYVEAMIGEYSAAIQGGNLKLNQAVAEFNKRLGALSEGNNMFAKMVGYAIPKGGDYPQADFYKNLANGGPGGLTGGPPTTQTINPFAQAAATMEGIPNFMDFGVPEAPDLTAYLDANKQNTNPFLSALNESVTRGQLEESRLTSEREKQRINQLIAQGEGKWWWKDEDPTSGPVQGPQLMDSGPNTPNGNVLNQVGDIGEFWWEQLTKFKPFGAGGANFRSISPFRR